MRAFAHAFLLASLLAGCRKPAADDAAKPEVEVQAAHPETGAITEEISADATLAPIAQAAILPKVSAPIRRFYVQRGSQVKAGQLLATLENSDLAAAALDNSGALKAAQASYTQATKTTVPEDQTKAQTDLNQAKSTLDLQNRIVQSRQQLFAEGAIPGRDLDTAKSAAVQAQAAFDIAKQKYENVLKIGAKTVLDTAEGQLTSAKGKYLGAEAQLGYTSIRTPISGVVTDRPLFAGETAAAGSPIVTVMDTSSMLAKLHLAQAQAQQLKIGSAATLNVPGIDEPIDAKVSLISPAVDPGSTTVEVWLKAANPKAVLKAGTPVKVTLEGRSASNALLVPTDAIQRSSEGEGKIVMVVAADGTSKKRPVTIGIETKEKTQVLTGIEQGDMVITSGGYGLDEGSKVKVVPASAKPSAAGSDDAHGAKE